MRGYLTIPSSIYCKPCKECGAQPIVALVSTRDDYVVKCPNSNAHYQTQAGLIDLEDWNIHNTVLYERDRVSNGY